MSELVTGEAVVLELRLARPATRMLALGIDLLLESGAFLLVLLPVSAAFPGVSNTFVRGVLILIGVLIFVGYATAFETLTRGKSVGKYALGLRVVSDDGGPVRFRQALARALAGVFVDFFTTLGVAGFLVSMLNPRGKRVGDLLAGTLVVRERMPAASAAAVAPLPEVPATLRSWAATTELSRLPDELAMSARSYLSRWHSLSPSAQQVLGDRLVTSFMKYVSPPPPDSVPAWAYLAAVLSERRDRALRRAGSPGSDARASGPAPFGPAPSGPDEDDEGFAPPR